MDDKTMQRKLNQIVKLVNELSDEAKRRWGRNAQVFFEAEGGPHIMSGDTNGNSTERQAFIKFSAKGWCRHEVGAW